MKYKDTKLTNYNSSLLLKKRPVIEAVFDILTSVFDLHHTRHRKPINALVHLMAGLVAYQFYPGKPAVNIDRL